MTPEESRQIQDSIVSLTEQIKHLAWRMDVLKTETNEHIDELKHEQDNRLEELKRETSAQLKKIEDDQALTRDIFNKGRGALYLLTALGAVTGVVLEWGRDILRPWAH